MMAKEKQRTQITWKLDRLSEKQKVKVNRWGDNQQNMQASITSVMLHMIDRFGDGVDFLDFDVQKELYTEVVRNSAITEQQIDNENDTTKEPVIKEQVQDSSSESENAATVVVNPEEEEEEEYSIFNNPELKASLTLNKKD